MLFMLPFAFILCEKLSSLAYCGVWLVTVKVYGVWSKLVTSGHAQNWVHLAGWYYHFA